MSADDETRLMEVRRESMRLSSGRLDDVRDAETPCVGVASVGDTHFGETQSVVLPAGAGDVEAFRNPNRLTSDTTSTTRVRRVRAKPIPRPLAIALGLLFGVGMAVLLALGRSTAEPGAPAPSMHAAVVVAARTSDHEGLVEVPVQVQNHVVMTDEVGEARFPEVDLRGGLSVRARCPDGYAGRDLVREIPASVSRETARWEFQLVCQPDFVDVAVLVETTGCGEVQIWMDGVESGTTQEGRLLLVRRIHQDEVVEVRAKAMKTPCEMESVRHVSLSTRQSQANVEFVGAPIRVGAPRSRRAISPASSRPYRL